MRDITLRAATADDYDFCYRVQKATMQEYVEQTWGWDEAFQQAYFRQRFDPARNQVIVLGGADIGVFAVERRERDIFLAKIYILPEYQRRGIGTGLIKLVLQEAFKEGLPVTLRVLKVNPARRLYERLGFAVIEENDEFFIMRATPPAEPDC